MSDVRVRVVGSSFIAAGERYVRDDELTVDDAIADRHPNTLDRIDSSDGDTDTTEAETADVTESGYSRGELEAMDYQELRDLATDADNPDINGRSSRDDIVDALADDGDNDAGESTHTEDGSELSQP